MSIESELFTLITGDAGVGALIGTRMYPKLMPPEATLPAIVYGEVATETVVQADGDTNARMGRYSVSYWATSYSGIKAGRAALLSAVNGYAGGSIGRIAVLAMADDYEPETQYFRQVMELEIFYSD